MDKKEKRNLQVFGYGLGVIIVFITIRLGMKHGFTNGKYSVIALAALLGLITAFKLDAIRPLYKIWMKGARFIGEIVNFVILSFIFYIFFGSAGIILRLLGKDILDEKINKNALTYWKTSRLGPFERERYTKQF